MNDNLSGNGFPESIYGIANKNRFYYEIVSIIIVPATEPFLPFLLGIYNNNVMTVSYLRSLSSIRPLAWSLLPIYIVFPIYIVRYS